MLNPKDQHFMQIALLIFLSLLVSTHIVYDAGPSLDEKILRSNCHEYPILGEPRIPPPPLRIRSSHRGLSKFGSGAAKTVADPEFPQGGGTNSPMGVPTYDFAKFSQNCMKLKNLDPQGGTHPSHPP